jgi:hypothetical protein
LQVGHSSIILVLLVGVVVVVKPPAPSITPTNSDGARVGYHLFLPRDVSDPITLYNFILQQYDLACVHSIPHSPFTIFTDASVQDCPDTG